MNELVAASVILVAPQLKQAHREPTISGLVFCFSEGVQVWRKKETDLARELVGDVIPAWAADLRGKDCTRPISSLANLRHAVGWDMLGQSRPVLGATLRVICDVRPLGSVKQERSGHARQTYVRRSVYPATYGSTSENS